MYFRRFACYPELTARTLYNRNPVSEFLHKLVDFNTVASH